MKKIRFIFTTIALFLAGSSTVLGHVTVNPKAAIPNSYQTFIIAVPTEKEMPTTELRLVVPDGIQSITPNVKPGWTIEIKKTGEKITEIMWTGGTIPPGQRDEFTISAKTPVDATTLSWNAYQTYSDKSIVPWENLSLEVAPAPKPAASTISPSSPALAISLVAFVFSLTAIARIKRLQKNSV